MDLILAGPGRAGLSLTHCLRDAGHSFVGVLARDRSAADSAAASLSSIALRWDHDLPAADLLLIAVRDDAIGAVAAQLADRVGAVAGAVHLSGLTPVAVLDPLRGPMLGSFHPLQTLPDPLAGAARLEGAWAAVTTQHDFLADRLFGLAGSIGMHPFEVEDEAKPLYHAAAAAAANYPLAALAMAERLFVAAGVPFAAAGPLIEAVVANAAELGPIAALTGPIARGDVDTVAAQLKAVAAATPDLLDAFKAFGRSTARAAGTEELMAEVLE